jgi:hypothetical protein
LSAIVIWDNNLNKKNLALKKIAMPCYYDNKRFNKIQFVEVFLCGFSFALTSFNKMNFHKEEPKQGQVFFPDHLLRKVDSARSNLLPQKSSGRYLKEYKVFCN